MTDFNKCVADTVDILNLAEVNLMGLSEEDRRKSLILEQEMTETANRGDTETFFKVLDEWRGILMRAGGDDALFHRKAA